MDKRIRKIKSGDRVYLPIVDDFLPGIVQNKIGGHMWYVTIYERGEPVRCVHFNEFRMRTIPLQMKPMNTL
jgi:hypothetical protein